MRKRCSSFEEALVDLAEGRERSDAAEHVAECADCAAKLKQLKQILQVAQLARRNAPSSAIHLAKSLFPSVRTVRAKLIRSSLALGGARATEDSFQAIFGAEEVEVRVSYSRVGTDAWEVRGMVGPTLEVSREAQEVFRDPEGGFSFNAKSLAETDFSISAADLKIEIPSGLEAIDGN